MSDMQQNFDEQLAGKESEMSSRLDNMSQKHESDLSGVSLTCFFHCSFTCGTRVCIIIEMKRFHPQNVSVSCCRLVWNRNDWMDIWVYVRERKNKKCF